MQGHMGQRPGWLGARNKHDREPLLWFIGEVMVGGAGRVGRV